jgi:hypothetical protein
VITEIGDDYFLLNGRITIGDTPDAGRSCYRLREFERCDYLTDYADIYSASSLG